jgi:hypothetical protein
MPVPPYAAPISVPFHTPDVIVPTEVKLELTTVEFSVVPVRVPAAAVTVQLDPKVQVDPFTVVEALARSVFVTSPVAVKDEVTVNPETEGDVASTTLPLPVVARSPSVPPLSYKI